jgi:hypothetical protein
MLKRGGATQYIRIFDFPNNWGEAAVRHSAFIQHVIKEGFWITDDNGDDAVTLSEWKRQYERFADPADATPEAAFATSDKNGDGIVTADEFPSTCRPATVC